MSNENEQYEHILLTSCEFLLLYRVTVVYLIFFSDTGGRKLEESFEGGQNSFNRSVTRDSTPSRVSSLDNIRTMSTVIAAER